MTFGIFFGDYGGTFADINAYLEFFLPSPAGVSNLVRIDPPPGIILPDPTILCSFGNQLRCIEIDRLRLTMISGKVLHYGTVRQ